MTSNLLNFLNKIEGAGYGGMSEFELARTEAAELVAWHKTDLRRRYGAYQIQLEHAVREIEGVLNYIDQELIRDELPENERIEEAIVASEEIVSCIEYNAINGRFQTIIDALDIIDAFDTEKENSEESKLKEPR